MPRLSQVERDQAIGMLTAGMTQAEVARRLGCHCCTIARLRQRYRQTGVTRDRPRSGQPRVTTVAQDRRIRTMHLRNRLRPATMTATDIPGRNLPRINARTVQLRFSLFLILMSVQPFHFVLLKCVHPINFLNSLTLLLFGFFSCYSMHNIMPS